MAAIQLLFDLFEQTGTNFVIDPMADTTMAMAERSELPSDSD